MVDQKTFRARLLALITRAIEVDANTLPKLYTVNEDGSQMNPEQRAMMSIGMVVASLCTGITHNLKTIGAASTPQSVASITAAIRWTLSYLDSTKSLDRLYEQISDDNDYVNTLYECFRQASHTSLAGYISGIGIEPAFETNALVDYFLDNWAFDVVVNIFAFCAARDIFPEL